MKIDVLVAEIGSTTTIVNAFNIHTNPKFLGRGVANTTVSTDVTEGLQLAIEDLSAYLGVDKLEYVEMFASSSAAGGLKMTVHGLVYEMTVRASKEAALNAGANIHLVTANKVTEKDLSKIKKVNPNIILVAGGTDYGERETALYNIEKVAKLDINVPIIYAGNIENHDEIKELFELLQISHRLKIVENVYPRVDYLNILPLRKIIYETFEENITKAKGMEKVHNIVNQKIMPTPGSVMEATMMLYNKLGNVMTIDVGGATTDIHSVANPSDEFAGYLEGEPLSKRSVEGDLGVFINYKNILELYDINQLSIDSGLSTDRIHQLIENYQYIPKTEEEFKFVKTLTKKCVEIGLDRHVGDLRRVFTSSGQKIIPEGKDLTNLEYVILTGGALVNNENTKQIVEQYIKRNPTKLLPRNKIKIIKDKDYIMASLGVLSLKYPEEAFIILKKSLQIEV